MKTIINHTRLLSITIQGLYSFNKRVSLPVNNNRLLFIGPNASGKSNVIRCVEFLIRHFPLKIPRSQVPLHATKHSVLDSIVDEKDNSETEEEEENEENEEEESEDNEIESRKDLKKEKSHHSILKKRSCSIAKMPRELTNDSKDHTEKSSETKKVSDSSFIQPPFIQTRFELSKTDRRILAMLMVYCDILFIVRDQCDVIYNYYLNRDELLSEMESWTDLLRFLSVSYFDSDDCNLIRYNNNNNIQDNSNNNINDKIIEENKCLQCSLKYSSQINGNEYEELKQKFYEMRNKISNKIQKDNDTSEKETEIESKSNHNKNDSNQQLESTLESTLESESEKIKKRNNNNSIIQKWQDEIRSEMFHLCHTINYSLGFGTAKESSKSEIDENRKNVTQNQSKERIHSDSLENYWNVFLDAVHVIISRSVGIIKQQGVRFHFHSLRPEENRYDHSISDHMTLSPSYSSLRMLIDLQRYNILYGPNSMAIKKLRHALQVMFSLDLDLKCSFSTFLQWNFLRKNLDYFHKLQKRFTQMCESDYFDENTCFILERFILLLIQKKEEMLPKYFDFENVEYYASESVSFILEDLLDVRSQLKEPIPISKLKQSLNLLFKRKLYFKSDRKQTITKQRITLPLQLPTFKPTSWRKNNRTKTNKISLSIDDIPSGVSESVLILTAALMSDAGSIFLDEPGVQLHSPKRTQLRRLLSACQRDMIISTHSPDILMEGDYLSTYHFNILDSETIISPLMNIMLTEEFDAEVKIRSTRTNQLIEIFQDRCCLTMIDKDLIFNVVVESTGKHLSVRKYHRQKDADLKDLSEVPDLDFPDNLSVETFVTFNFVEFENYEPFLYFRMEGMPKFSLRAKMKLGHRLFDHRVIMLILQPGTVIKDPIPYHEMSFLLEPQVAQMLCSSQVLLVEGFDDTRVVSALHHLMVVPDTRQRVIELSELDDNLLSDSDIEEMNSMEIESLSSSSEDLDILDEENINNNNNNNDDDDDTTYFFSTIDSALSWTVISMGGKSNLKTFTRIARRLHIKVAAILDGDALSMAQRVFKRHDRSDLLNAGCLVWKGEMEYIFADSEDAVEVLYKSVHLTERSKSAMKHWILNKHGGLHGRWRHIPFNSVVAAMRSMLTQGGSNISNLCKLMAFMANHSTIAYDSYTLNSSVPSSPTGIEISKQKELNIK